MFVVNQNITSNIEKAKGDCGKEIEKDKYLLFCFNNARLVFKLP